jgi:hypothetical protein
MGHPAVRAGILPACLARRNSGRDVRRKAGETPALPARRGYLFSLMERLSVAGKNQRPRQ